MKGEEVNDNHKKKTGEAVNTAAMKLTKTDQELVEELRDIIDDAVISRMVKLHLRGVHVEVNLDNGTGPFKFPKLVTFVAKKDLINWQTEDRPVAPKQ